MAPRLKVFVTSDGLTDYVVATTSRAKALAAWGVRQDVFKEGLAREADDDALAAAAQAQPGEVLRRPTAARDELARLKPKPKPKPETPPATAKAEPAPEPKPKGPTKAQLKKVADLEARLAELDARREAERADLARQRREIERRQAELARRDEAQATAHAAARAELEAALSAARQALG